MPKISTVFEIGKVASEPGFPPEIYITMGVFILLCGTFLFIATKLNKLKRLKKNVPLTMVFVGCIWLSISPVLLSKAESDHKLQDKYINGDFEIEEGIVKVLRTQPKQGHAPSDLIKINNKQFEINYSKSTTTYNKTLSNGGHLSEGTFVRIYHNGNDIFRVDVFIKKNS